ncbi:hypothetical protein Bbelb_012800 [Branchiostoma belcheri]|nr:hypothetical protein Bbelb_012800 [Branchiostoma belcheri]
MARDQHISSSERLLSYSDAVFSIITTIMIVPLGGETVEEINSSEAGIAWQAYTRPNLLEEDEARYGEIAWALLVMVLLEPLLRQVIISIYYFAKGNGEAGCKGVSPSRLVVERSDPLRTKVYSDGVYAIIATLIILDICVENVPSKDEDIAKHGDLISALKHDQHVFMSYAGTFITICMLWYLHHSIFYRIFAENHLLQFFNKLALMFAGLLPIVFKITGEFGKDVSAGDAALAVQLNACTVQISTPAVFIIIKIIRNCVQRVEDRKRSSDEETPERSHLAEKENNIDHGNEITAV